MNEKHVGIVVSVFSALMTTLFTVQSCKPTQAVTSPSTPSAPIADSPCNKWLVERFQECMDRSTNRPARNADGSVPTEDLGECRLQVQFMAKTLPMCDGQLPD